jgi:YaiO family outer membrane protein
VENGRVVRRVVPKAYLPLCQTLEYVRSFTTARSGFTRLDCLLILSGAFLVMRRDVALSLGGFLTGRVRSRLLDEYAGPGKGTVGEDMEMIVRLHRHERENGRHARVVHSALPVCWTEVPSTWTVLGRQRRRWHRGLLEILRYHRSMLFDPAYGRIGLFSFPFIALFEGVGPYLEAAGWVLLPVVLLMGWMDPVHALLLTAVTLGVGILHSMIAVLCATWLEPVVPTGSRVRSVLGVDRWRDRGLLLAACVLSELGYRQMTLVWRMQGTWEAIRGKGSWGAMERRGFRTAAKSAGVAAIVTAAVMLGAPAAIASGAEASTAARVESAGTEEAAPVLRFRESWAVFAAEHRDGRDPGGWFETATKWDRRGATRTRSMWAGVYGFSREAGDDLGVIAGIAASVPRRIGGSMELRAAPGAAVSARVAAAAETEIALRRPFSATALARGSWFADATTVEAAPGVIAYLPRESWLAVKAHWTRTSFDDGQDDDVFGWSGTFAMPVGRVETRLLASSSGESYLSGFVPEPARMHAYAIGATARVPFGRASAIDAGWTARLPERGENDVTFHAGLRHRW